MQPFPTATASPPQAKSKYCCTLCDYQRPFKNQSDWKKHEREHDTTYVCMLKGAREATPQGSQCAFYGILDPHDDHLLKHNAQACLHGPPESFSSKRRHDMVNHLGKIHGIFPKSQGEAIAVKWKYTVKKQAWSCGFCVNTFVTFSDRLSHIATQHFENGQTIDEWDATNVIQGLLRQSGMTKAWQDKLASLPAWEVPDIVWEKDAIIDLQHHLEVGPRDNKSAVGLAEAAYIACRLNWGMEKQRVMAVTDMTFATTAFPPKPFQARMACSPGFGFNLKKSEPIVQGFDESLSEVTATQSCPSLNYGYSSATILDPTKAKNTGLASPPFIFQQTQSVTEHHDTENDGYGDPGNDMAGSFRETEFDELFT